MSWPDRAIAAIAEGQQGQVHRDQLLELGVGPSAISHSLRRGRIFQTFKSVYGVGHRALPPLWREMGAVLACGDDAFVSDHWALGAWEIRPKASGDVDITVPYGRSARRAGIRIHRTKNVDPRDLRTLDGVPIASPALALLDVAEDLALDDFERAFDDALTKRLMTVAGARRTLARYPHRRGTRRFAELARPDHELQITRSKAEQLMKAQVRKGNLPVPELNLRRGRIIPDFIWRRERVIVEVDGFRTHGTRRAFENDRARDAALAASGWIVVRFTWRQLERQPEVVLVRIAQVLAVRAPHGA